MNQQSLRKANHFYLHDEISSSIEWNKSFLANTENNRANSMARSDSAIALTVSADDLGLTKLANNAYAESLETHCKNAFAKVCESKINRDFEYPKRKKLKLMNKQMENNFLHVMSSSYIKKLNEINKKLQKNQNCMNYSIRAIILNAIGDKKNSLQDIITMTTIDPLNPSVWEAKANYSYQVNDLDLCLEAAKNCEELKAPSYIYYAHYFWDKNDVDNAMKYINLAVKRKEKYSLFFRAKFNFERGYIREALRDDKSLPIYIFAVSPFPTRIPDDVNLSCPYLYYLLSGYYFSFHKPLYEIPHGLFVPLRVQFAWFHGLDINLSIKQLPNFQVPTIYHSSKSLKNLKEIVKCAFNIGKCVDSTLLSSRSIVCIGFAILEISQLISSFLIGKDVHLPTLETIYSILTNWFRFINPSIPIFIRTDIPNYNRYIFFEKSGSKTIYDKFIPQLLNLFKKYYKSKSSEILEKISLVETPEDLWNVVRNKTTVPIPNSKSKIFISSGKYSLVDFGIVFASDDDINLDVELISKWYSIMNNIRSGVITKEIFEFIYLWLRDIPLTFYTDYSGIILMTALIRSIFNLVPNVTFPTPFEFHFHSLLCEDLDSFLEYLSSLNISYTSFKGKIKPICIILPNLHARYHALLEFI